jgi:hypothetical protein
VGLLLPLPVHTQVWSDISIDFVEGLPKVGGKSVILTVVDRLSKYAHFIPLTHPYTTEMVAPLTHPYTAEMVAPSVCLHGIPTSIVSYRDPVFTSTFWQALFRAIGSKLHMSFAFHPQSDGQTKAIKKNNWDAPSLYDGCSLKKLDYVVTIGRICLQFIFPYSSQGSPV